MLEGFAPLRALGERQLQVQFTLSSMYDTQAMGLLGLNAALAAAAIAGDKLLGRHWWLALIGLLVSSGLAGWALFVRPEEVGLDLTLSTGLAEEARKDEMDRAIVVGLSEAIDLNDEQLDGKRGRVSLALVALILTIIGAIVGVWVF
jgi:hypothetical protein